MRRIALRLGAAAFAVGLSALPAGAADKFPSRPITLINPFTPGGPVDAHFRVIAQQGEKIFGVPIVIENRPGAGATLGPATMAATAKPDGYTLSNLSAGVYSVPHMQKVAFDPTKDFTYIIQLIGYRFRLAVRRDAPWQSWKELVADARANPGKIPYASTGTGGGIFLTIEQISLASGIKLLHVPFRGSSEAVAALLGGHIQVGAFSANSRALFESGDFRALLALTPQRNPMLPGVPSLTDEGIQTAIDLSFPYGIGGPKGMDPAIVRILHDGFRKIREAPEYKAILEQLDMEDRYLGSDDYRAFALTQIAANRKVLETLGVARQE